MLLSLWLLWPLLLNLTNAANPNFAAIATLDPACDSRDLDKILAETKALLTQAVVVLNGLLSNQNLLGNPDSINYMIAATGIWNTQLVVTPNTGYNAAAIATLTRIRNNYQDVLSLLNGNYVSRQQLDSNLVPVTDQNGPVLQQFNFNPGQFYVTCADDDNLQGAFRTTVLVRDVHPAGPNVLLENDPDLAELVQNVPWVYYVPIGTSSPFFTNDQTSQGYNGRVAVDPPCGDRDQAKTLISRNDVFTTRQYNSIILCNPAWALPDAGDFAVGPMNHDSPQKFETKAGVLLHELFHTSPFLFQDYYFQRPGFEDQQAYGASLLWEIARGQWQPSPGQYLLGPGTTAINDAYLYFAIMVSASVRWNLASGATS